MSDKRPSKRIRPNGANTRLAEPYGSEPKDSRPTFQQRRDDERWRLQACGYCGAVGCQRNQSSSAFFNAMVRGASQEEITRLYDREVEAFEQCDSRRNPS